MKSFILSTGLVALAASPVAAFPHLASDAFGASVREAGENRNPLSEVLEDKRENKRSLFDPETQAVDVSGDHAFQAPDLEGGDQRGPCPGLNALANHGYLPHNGVAPLTTIVEAVNSVYGMALDLGGFLAAYGTVFDGNPLSLTPGYSIGGPSSASSNILGNLLGLLGTPQGLSGSHNKYEADTSPTRGDLYTAGDDYTVQLDQFEQFYNALPDNMDAPSQYSALFDFRVARFEHSINTNPYFFYPQFAGMIVTPAGYSFTTAMMANHSDEYPTGYLDKETFKSFFAITGEPGSFSYNEGYERIPENWYKRPLDDEYSIPLYLLDLLQFGLRDPRLLSIGGNTGTTNSFTGIDLGNLTGGVFNAETLADGNNLQCYIYQTIMSEAPDVLEGVFSDVTTALEPLTSILEPLIESLGCPQLDKVDESQFDIYPGYQKSNGSLRR